MAIRVLLAAATFTVLACSGCGGPKPLPASTPYMGGRVFDRADIEKYGGTIVVVEGEFQQIKGEHGLVKLDSGLNVYLPNVHLRLRGEPWFDYVHKRVVVQGLLRTDSSGIAGISGPSMDTIDYFRVIEQ